MYTTNSHGNMKPSQASAMRKMIIAILSWGYISLVIRPEGHEPLFDHRKELMFEPRDHPEDPTMLYPGLEDHEPGVVPIVPMQAPRKIIR